MASRVLWIGDEAEALRAGSALREYGIVAAGSIWDAVERAGESSMTAAVLQLPCADCVPEEALYELLRSDPGLPLIVHDPSGTVDDAIRLTRMGAFYVLLGDLDLDRLEAVIASALDRGRSRQVKTQGAEEAEPWRRLLVGESRTMQQICDAIRLVAARRCTILISGETGTGKEVVARAIHMAGNRSHLPMVAVNCSALPANLIEAELFGHTRGAFTGAHTSRVGRFEQANHGTLFLDEIGDLPLGVQSKLLRVLQEQEFQRVGSSETVRVDVRIIAASNMDLEQAVREHRFREDLFYRLNVVPVRLPALRDRREDIPLLLQHFVGKTCRAESLAEKQISPETMDRLSAIDWPGNVRQLEHAVEMAVAFSGDRRILYPSDFPVAASGRERPEPKRPWITVPEEGLDFDEVVSDFEKSLLDQALTHSGGNKARAADLLHIKRTTLLARMKTLEERDCMRSRTAHSANQLARLHTATGTVLLVEHEAAVRRFMAVTLTEQGYRVLEAATSSAAFELYQCWRNGIDLMIADAGLPGMSGTELARRIRRQSPFLSVLMIAGTADDADECYSATDVCSGFLTRPFAPQALLARVADQLSATRSNTAAAERAVCA
ncbi:MAG: sigma 54-interacting transcriptional regulator [Bryobacteraceae bacterium]